MGKRLAVDKVTVLRRVVIFCSEFLGTFILVFLGCMGCMSGIAGGPIPHQQISFTFGLAVMVAVQCFGHVSGSHINPAVTVSSAILGYTQPMLIPIYLLGQFIGAIAGFATLMLVTPGEFFGNKIVDGIKNVGVCSPGVNSELSAFQGAAVEFIATSILILLCCAVWDRKNTDKHDSLSIRFGLTIAVLAMAAGPYSGANMNPARSFAPALLNGDWKDHWVYWVGPLAAGIIPTIIYKYLFQTPPPEEELGEGLPLN